MQGKSSPIDAYPFQEIHQLLQFPTFILVETKMVDPDFDLRQHNEVWEIAYPVRHKDETALKLLTKSCSGKLLSEDEMTQLKEETQ